jgi:hypothetical protein
MVIVGAHSSESIGSRRESCRESDVGSWLVLKVWQ